MLQKVTVIAAWASIALLTYGTLSHVGFVYSIYFKLAPFLMRANMRTYAHFEHVIAFAFFTPDRHGTLIDASEKIAGGALGILAARAMLWLRNSKIITQ
jgi:hypothetical protein